MVYARISQIELSPDVYGGKECDKIVPRWKICTEGDKDADFKETALVLDPEAFPPGTMIEIKEPCCPECDVPRSVCDCGFDWDEWTRNYYC